MDTDGIRLFAMAAQLLNISAAGRQLGLAPAVASARLAKLEKQLGADLLHRSTRQVSLSLEGEEFLPFAREMLAQEDAALAALGHGSAWAWQRGREGNAEVCRVEYLRAALHHTHPADLPGAIPQDQP